MLLCFRNSGMSNSLSLLEGDGRLGAGAGVGVAVLPMDIVEQSARPEGLKTYALSAGGIGWMVCAMLGRDAVVSEPERALLELIRREFGGKRTEVEVFPGFYEGEM